MLTALMTGMNRDIVIFRIFVVVIFMMLVRYIIFINEVKKSVTIKAFMFLIMADDLREFFYLFTHFHIGDHPLKKE